MRMITAAKRLVCLAGSRKNQHLFGLQKKAATRPASAFPFRPAQRGAIWGEGPLTTASALRTFSSPFRATAASLATATGGILLLLTSTKTTGESTKTTFCEEPVDETIQELDGGVTPPNPLWPAGVDAEQVNALVDDCLNDPGINIAAIPDYIERQIYKSTIQLTLNLIYHLLGQLHGQSILAHELQLHRLTSKEKGTEQSLSQLRNDLDEKVLEAMADRLLADKAVNQSLIPDVLERQVYVNCLKIVFRLLDLLSASMAVTVCGHQFRLNIEAKQRQELLTSEAEKVVLQRQQEDRKVHKICTAVDTDLLLQYAAEEAGVDWAQAHSERSLWSRLFSPTTSFGQEFMVQLHASLYGLILGIVDDLLEQTQLELLNDQVQLDLVPVPEAVRHQRASKNALAVTDEAKPTKKSGGGGAYLPFASFTMGVGVGLALMAALTKRF